MANRECLCCHNEYDFCPNCGAGRLDPAWKSVFCSEPCKELWQTLSRFSMNFITKADAKSVILGLDLKPIESYASCVQRGYAKVMHEEKKPRKAKSKEFVVEIEEQPEFEAVIEQSIEVAEPVAIEPVYEVVLEEKE